MTKKTKNRKSVKRIYRRKTRRYRGRGGCNSNSCALSASSPSATPLWTGKGGSHQEQISNDIYNSVVDPSFYSI
jgi:hypothetical protein